MKGLFNPYGAVMRALSDLSTLVFLNALTGLFCIPVVTAGASFAAMHYVIMDMIEDKGGPVIPEFRKRFKENLKNATPVWLIIMAAALLLFADYRIIEGGKLGLPKLMVIPIYAAIFMLIAVYVYVMPLTAKFVLSTRAAFKNAVILAIAYLPKTFLMIAISVVIPFVLLNSMMLLPLFFLIGLSLPAYFCALVYLPIIEEMQRSKGETEKGETEGEISSELKDDIKEREE